MRILYVLTSLGIGGAERQVIQLAERMAARGHAVSLMVLLPCQPNQWPTELDVYFLGMHRTLWGALRGLWSSVALLRRLRPQVVHSHTFPANLMARWMRCFLPAITLVATLHNVWEGGALRMAAYRLTAWMVSATTAVSQDVADTAIAAHIVEHGRCTVMPNGIDMVEFAPHAERRRLQRESMQVPDGVFVWLAAGRLTPAKDFPNLLRAFAQLKTKSSEARLWIAGEGDSAYVDQLHQKALDEGLEGWIHWLGLRRDLAALLDAADGFVLSSSWEGMPLVVGEAMAMETAVVATDVGGVREWLGEMGRVVPPHAKEALAEAMWQTMQEEEEQRAARNRQARQRIAEHYSMESLAQRWEEFYKGL